MRTFTKVLGGLALAGTAAVATMVVNQSPGPQTHQYVIDGDTVTVAVNLSPRRKDTVKVLDTVTIRDTVRLPATDPVVIAPAVARPLMFAPFHEPMRNINAGLGYTGTVKVMSYSYYKAILDSAKAAKSQVGFYMTTDRRRFRFPTDTLKLNVKHWKAYVLDTLYGPRISTIRPFIDDSTIKFMYMVDEYDCRSCWGGMIISHAQIDSLAMFTKALFKGSDGKSVPVAVRVDPSKMNFAWKYVDISWAQFSGATHYPAACGGCGGNWAKSRAYAMLTTKADSTKVSLDSLYFLVGKAFADSMVKAAKAYKLALVLGANSMDGGDGYSKMKGIGGEPTRWIMAPGEYTGVTRAFVTEPYVCGSFNWKSSFAVNPAKETVANPTAALAFDTLAAVRAGNARNRLIALSRPSGPCAVR